VVAVDPVIGQFWCQIPRWPGPLSLHWKRRPGTRLAV
jgi:hypothetical protein